MELTQKGIEGLLTGWSPEEVKRFAAYIIRLKLEKKKGGGQLKNPWIQKKTSEQMVDLFKRVAAESLSFDGVHVTLQSTGVSYDYVAYKNRMIHVYPETLLDLQLVYKTDTFTVAKSSGKVIYTHDVSEPFNQKDEDIEGGYCVIKNKRGEFLTLLSKDEIAKHRKVAKTDSIWASWFKEMCLKTVIKKAIKYHFDDVYTAITEMDNENDAPEQVTEKEKPAPNDLQWNGNPKNAKKPGIKALLKQGDINVDQIRDEFTLTPKQEEELSKIIG